MWDVLLPSAREKYGGHPEPPGDMPLPSPPRSSASAGIPHTYCVRGEFLLPGKGSNPDLQIQSLTCCQLHHPGTGAPEGDASKHSGRIPTHRKVPGPGATKRSTKPRPGPTARTPRASPTVGRGLFGEKFAMQLSTCLRNPARDGAGLRLSSRPARLPRRADGSQAFLQVGCQREDQPL